MVSGEDHQDNWLVRHPDDSSAIGNEGSRSASLLDPLARPPSTLVGPMSLGSVPGVWASRTGQVVNDSLPPEVRPNGSTAQSYFALLAAGKLP
jgi:hypothetical protein